MRGIFMYLKTLYRQSKFWFAVVVLFAGSQLFLNYKNGVELSPFYHYGMFSLPFHFTPTYECVEISIDGKRLQTKDFTPNSWDNMVIPVIQYNQQREWNSMMYNKTIRRLLPVSDSTPYTYQLSQQNFDAWYRQRVRRLLRINDTATVIQYQLVSYRQEKGTLIP